MRANTDGEMTMEKKEIRQWLLVVAIAIAVAAIGAAWHMISSFPLIP